MLWESPCSVQVSVSIHNRAPRWLTKREDSPRRAARHACAQLFSFYSQTSAPLAQSNSPRHAVQLHERVRGTRDHLAPDASGHPCRAGADVVPHLCTAMPYVSACMSQHAATAAPGALHAAAYRAAAQALCMQPGALHAHTERFGRVLSAHWRGRKQRAHTQATTHSCPARRSTTGCHTGSQCPRDRPAGCPPRACSRPWAPAGSAHHRGVSAHL